MAIDVVEILSKMRRPPSSYSIDCEGWRAESPPRRFTRIRLLHRAAGPALDEGSVRRAVDLSQEKYCSAMASLDPAIVVENEIVLSRKEESV
jgi:putative redox protein